MTDALSKSSESESPDVLLEQFAREANENFAEAQTHAQASKAKSEQAVASALLCGQALARAKEVCGSRKFGQWLCDNCPQIHRSTAYRWIALASSVAHATIDGRTLTQLYIETGVLNPKPPTEREHRPLLDWFQGTVESLQSRLKKLEAEIQTDEQRKTFGQFCAELQKISRELCEKMGVDVR